MDHELLEGAACAGADLTARLLAELRRAGDRLAMAKKRAHADAIAGRPPSERARRELRHCRSHVDSLRRLLAGMPAFDGGGHAASA